MAEYGREILKNTRKINVVPFQNAEEAWFWFVAAQQARLDGARFSAGLGLYPRPCEPLDVLKALDQLVRRRRLLRDHLLVLRHYGRRAASPDKRRVKEMRAFTLWSEAMERLSEIFIRKGIVAAPAEAADAPPVYAPTYNTSSSTSFMTWPMEVAAE